MNSPLKNHILSALPTNEYQRLSDRLEPFELVYNDVLLEPKQEPEWLYFPTAGVVSLVSILDGKSTTETGTIGFEGVVGVLPFLGRGVANNYSVVQIPGTAMRIEAEVLRQECDRSKILTKILLRYALELFNQVSQVAACNNHHTIEQRTARWLLMLDDRSNRPRIDMTHELLSKMLGVRRSGITETAQHMRQRSIINYHRGKIEIIDRQALEAIACECYQVLKIGVARTLNDEG